MRLSKKIHRKALKLDLESASKDEALEELVGLLCDAYKLKAVSYTHLTLPTTPYV